MKTDFWFPSAGTGRIHVARWSPEGQPKAVVQIVHGIAEYVERYDGFAKYLTGLGYLVVAEDHMGHGRSVNGGGITGYFHGGWFAAVEDTCTLLNQTREENPEIPYVLLGHSMGSFMVRTILCKYPDCPVDAAIISGTCWQPAAAMPAIVKVMETVCRKVGETEPNEKLQQLVFGSYNARVEHPRTALDWVSRDAKIVDAHPMQHGFRPTAGLLRDMMAGIRYIEQKENLVRMRRDLPVLFVAGGDDPVGNYGKGVHHTAEVFRRTGMQNVDVKIYPLCRHEILNEINRAEVFADLSGWMEKVL